MGILALAGRLSRPTVSHRLMIGALLAVGLIGDGSLVAQANLRDSELAMPITVLAEIRNEALMDAVVAWGLEGPNGELLIGRQSDRDILVLDQAGEVRLVIGRRGEGPGEFVALGRAGFRGDTLWVEDPSLRRVQLFDRQFRLVRIASIPSTTRLAGEGGPRGWSLRGVRAWLGTDRFVVLGERPSSNSGSGIEAALLLVEGKSGAIASTLLQLPNQECDEHGSFSGRPFHFRRPFCSPPIFAVTPNGDGVVTIVPANDDQDRTTARVEEWDGRGRKMWSHLLRVPAVEVTEAVRKQAYAVFEQPGIPPYIRDAVKASEVPRRYPAITGLLIGRDRTIGLIWEEASVGNRGWVQLSRNGGVDHNLRALPGVKILTIRQASGWGIREDELDGNVLLRLSTAR